MSTRTDWGWFDKEGRPLAVGDAHGRWECPKQEWHRVETMAHPFTGETELEWQPVQCPLRIQDQPRADICTRCGNQFRYP